MTLTNATALNLIKHPEVAKAYAKFSRVRRMPIAVTFHPVTREKFGHVWTGHYTWTTEKVTTPGGLA